MNESGSLYGHNRRKKILSVSLEWICETFCLCDGTKTTIKKQTKYELATTEQPASDTQTHSYREHEGAEVHCGSIALLASSSCTRAGG